MQACHCWVYYVPVILREMCDAFSIIIRDDNCSCRFVCDCWVDYSPSLETLVSIKEKFERQQKTNITEQPPNKIKKWNSRNRWKDKSNRVWRSKRDFKSK